jgi:hypothetical protein
VVRRCLDDSQRASGAFDLGLAIALASTRADSALANGLSGAHSQPMGINLFKIVDFPAVICVASIIALLSGSVAYYPFGVSVRTSVLVGAGIFALIFALLVATQWLPRKSK